MKVKFVTAFPSIAEGRTPNTVYLVSRIGSNNFDIRITLEDVNRVVSSISGDLVESLVDDKLERFTLDSSSAFFVDDISQRNALNPDKDCIVVVKDPTADPLFDSTNPSTLRDGMMYSFDAETKEYKPLMRLNSNAYTENLGHSHSNKNILDLLKVQDDKLVFMDKLVGGVFVDDPAW